MRTWWGRRRRGEAGATAVEYGLLIAGVAAVILLVPFAWVTMGDGICGLIAQANGMNPATAC